jgi:hypothetical protein
MWEQAEQHELDAAQEAAAEAVAGGALAPETAGGGS